MRESIPEKRIFPGAENPEVTKRKFSRIVELLKGTFDRVPAQNRPTVLDFRGLNPEATRQDFLKWVDKELGIKSELILEDGESRASKDKLGLLNSSYQIAKDFLRNTLKYPVEELSKDPKSIKSSKDVFALLSKTKLAKGKIVGLNNTMMYCRLVKTTVAAYEMLRHDAKAISILTQDFENELVTSSLDTNTNSPLVALGENKGNKKFFVKEKDDLNGSIETRDKQFKSGLLKFINRPESNAETALSDGIASRITIDEEKAVELVPILYTWLVEKMGVDYVTIENSGYLSPKQEKKLNRSLSEVFPKKNFAFISEKANAQSMGNFSVLKIKGVLSSHHNISKHAQQFEIQLVIPSNKNEEGKMHHSVYDVVKLVSARTRLDGFCPEDVFENFIEDAAMESGMSEKEIKTYLLDTNNAPIVKVRRNNRNFYVAHSVYARWNSFGWVDEKVFTEIEAARN